MLSIEIPAINYQKAIPSTWDELSQQDYLKIIELLLKLQTNEIEHTQFMQEFIIYLLDIRRSHRKLSEEDFLEFTSNIDLIAKQLNFIFDFSEAEDGKQQFTVKLTFIKNPIPDFDYHKQNFVGPDIALNDCTFEEFIVAHSHYLQYRTNPAPEHLTALAATLYRPERTNYNDVRTTADYDGKRREKFNQYRAEVRAKEFIQVNEHILYGIFMFFESVMNFITNHPKYSLLFNTKGDEQEATDKPDLGFMPIIFDLEERGLASNLDNLYNVLDIMYIDKIRALEIEKMYQKYDTNHTTTD